MKKSTPNICLIASVILFVISLTQKTYCDNGECGKYGDGLLAFLLGPFGLLAGGAYLTWFANPLLLTSWMIFKKNPIVGLILSIISFLICLSFLLFDEIMTNEAGHYGLITGYCLGYWLWTSSALMMLIGSIINLKFSYESKPNFD